ncbi:pyridoxal phosphate-dependent transferase [Xylariaceae sp. FL0016]|nr:pyridoxal phosphate-dependent transferase [Xylariaceae sp. FL0016]
MEYSQDTSITGFKPKPEEFSVFKDEEILDISSETEKPDSASHRSPVSEILPNIHLEETFETSKSQWVDDPIIRQWRDPGHRIHGVLSEPKPFGASSDLLWLEIGRVLADVGLPLYNNQVNMPDEIDTSWVFHFKAYEREALRVKGSRLGDPKPAGYICNPVEANLYCIRALQQELRETCPAQKPILLYDRFDLDGLHGITRSGTRPIIFAATLANHDGQCDDVRRIRNASSGRLEAGIEKLKLDNGHAPWAPVAALKPVSLGEQPVEVAYERASDSTLSGSRDALSILSVAVHEKRLGFSGFQHIHKYCADVRTTVMGILQRQGIAAIAPAYTLDIIITSRFSKPKVDELLSIGLALTDDGNLKLSIRPSLEPSDICSLLHLLGADSGYPVHMGSYSALGPVMGRFLDLEYPIEWVEAKARDVLTEQLTSFQGAFTNGSTMGNRVGIHVALMNCPNAFVYYSAESHYSVAKILRDCDALTSLWSDKGPRYAPIPGNSNGNIDIQALVKQANYRAIILANTGTTFVGARDNIQEIYSCLKEVGIAISHIHVDGALDCGFGTSDIQLGTPGTIHPNGLPLVQSVVLSHHKAMGITVSGEVLCYSPGGQLSLLAPEVDPRAIFETWLYLQMYSPSDMSQLLGHCQDSALRLERGLQGIGFVTKRHTGSIILVLERPPAWIIEELSLRPENEWVHFVTMPHVSAETIDLFIDRLSTIQKQCAVAFSYVTPLFEEAFSRSVDMRLLRCQDPMNKKISTLLESDLPPGKRPDLLSTSTTVKSFLRSAMSVLVLDSKGEIQAVILIDSCRDMSLRSGPILLARSHSSRISAVVDIAQQLVGFMAKLTYTNLRHTDKSFEVSLFS